MFCTIEDMVCRFGVEEMVCLADKSQPRTGLLNSSITSLTDPLATANEKRVLKAIEDACGEILIELSCCYNPKTIKEVYTPPLDPLTGLPQWPASQIIGLEHMCADIARYHLYDTIYLASEHNGKDHESFRRYEDVMTHLKSICACGSLMTLDCDVLEKKDKYVVEVVELCVDRSNKCETVCCSTCNATTANDCCCGGW